MTVAAACAGDPPEDTPSANRPPAVPDLALTPRDPRTDDTLRLEPLADLTDPDGDTVTLRVRWTVGDYVEPELVDALEVDAGWTTKGERWTAMVTAVDPDGLESEPAELSTKIENTPPEVTLSVTPNPPTSLDAIALNVVIDDPDDDDITSVLTWKLDGVSVPEWDGVDTIPASATERGQRWVAQVIASDEDDEADPATLEVTVADGPPTITNTQLTPDPVREGGQLTASATATDPEGDAISYAYSWSIDGAPLAGPDTATLNSTWFDEGDVVTATIVAVSAQGGRSAPATTPGVTVANTLPSLTSASISPASGDETTPFTCLAAGLTDLDPADTPTTTTTWLVNDLPVSTAPTLTGSSFSRGDEVVCRLTPRDEAGAGGSVDSSAIVIGNAPPRIPSITLGPAVATVLDTLTATAETASDPDGDSVSVAYTWRVNGSVIAPTTSTLTAPWFARGDSVVVAATPSDGTTLGASASSAALVISNAPPTLTNLRLSPADPHGFQDVTVLVDATDGDGDTVTLQHAWTVQGSAAGTQSATLPHATFVRDDLVAVTVTGTDGHGGSTPQSGQVVIGNAPPSGGTVLLTPGAPLSYEDLVCEVDAPGTDPEGDNITYTFAWYRNGSYVAAGIPTATSSTMPSYMTKVGESWSCRATACDTELCSYSAWSAAVSIAGVPCMANASDDNSGVCRCNLGYLWCDGSASECCAAPVLFDITITRATIASLDPDGNTWDAVLFTDPDAYVDVRVDGITQDSTTTVDDDATPAWNTTFTSVMVNTTSTLSFYVYDEDTFGSEYIGRFQIAYADLEDYVDQGSFTVAGNTPSLVSITFRIDTP